MTRKMNGLMPRGDSDWNHMSEIMSVLALLRLRKRVCVEGVIGHDLSCKMGGNRRTRRSTIWLVGPGLGLAIEQCRVGLYLPAYMEESTGYLRFKNGSLVERRENGPNCVRLHLKAVLGDAQK